MLSFRKDISDCGIGIVPEKLKKIGYDQCAAPYNAFKQETEIEIENVRVETYRSHLMLIAHAETLAYDGLVKAINQIPALTQPGKLFWDADLQGMPTTKDKKNIFLALFANPKLTNENRINIVKLLFERGYHDYYSQLLQPPIIENLLNDIQFSKIVNYLYKCYVDSSQSDVSLPTEKKIWNYLIEKFDANNSEILFELMLKNYEKRLRAVSFAEDWINFQTYQLHPILIYYKISRLLSEGYRLNIFDTDFNKMARQRILGIELEIHSNKLKNPKQLTDAHKRRVEKFIGTHRDSLFTCFRTKSKVIYDSILKDHHIEEASRAHEKEQIKMHHEINQKLTI